VIDGPDDAPAPGTTPAAPAPAPGSAPAPRAVVTEEPAPADTRSAVEKASDEARARIKAGQGADPTGLPTRKPTPRDEDSGKFTDQPKKKLPEPKPRTDTDPAHGEPEAGLEGEEDEDERLEGQERREEDRGSEGQPEGEAQEEIDEEEGPVEIDLPGRRPGETVKMQFMPEEVEEIQRLVKGYKRGEQVEAERAELNAREQQLADWQEAVELDPASAVARTLGNDPDALEHLALTILADPKMWLRVSQKVLAWDDPDRYELDAAKLQVEAANRRDEMRELAQERRVVDRNLSQVQASVAALIPSEGMSEDQAGTFYRDALRDLKEHADRYNLLTLDVRDIPLILASSGRLRAHGINPTDAAERIQEALSGTRRESRPAGGKPRTNGAPAPAKEDSPPPAKRGKDFATGSQRRKVAAAAPAGAGSPSTALTPPPGQTIEERTAWHRERMQKGKTLTR
jgi:hypothetical protein